MKAKRERLGEAREVGLVITCLRYLKDEARQKNSNQFFWFNSRHASKIQKKNRHYINRRRDNKSLNIFSWGGLIEWWENIDHEKILHRPTPPCDHQAGHLAINMWRRWVSRTKPLSLFLSLPTIHLPHSHFRIGKMSQIIRKLWLNV